MRKFIPIVATTVLLTATAALAQTTTTPPAPMPASPPVVNTLPSTLPSSPASTTEQAQKLVDRVIYSSDNKNIGEVAAVQRDSSGKLTELHADIGGFLGLGETRVRVTPAQFKILDDRVILNLTAEEAKVLPKIAK